MTTTTNTRIMTVATIEDRRDTREALGMLIDATPGFHCSGRHRSMEEALHAFSGGAPDVALCDIDLPGMSGIEGRMYQPLAAAVIAAMVAALVLALALVPIAAAVSLKASHATGNDDVTTATWLPATAAAAGPPPRNGTGRACKPAPSRMTSGTRCDTLPGPA